MTKKRKDSFAVIYTDPMGKIHNLGTAHSTSAADRRVESYKKKKGYIHLGFF